MNAVDETEHLMSQYRVKIGRLSSIDSFVDQYQYGTDTGIASILNMCMNCTVYKTQYKMMWCTNLQFKYCLVKRLRRRLGVRVFNKKLQRTQNCVEETIDDDFVDVIDVRFPDVTVFVGIQQLTV